MSRVVVAGIATVRIAMAVSSFPIPFAHKDKRPGGIDVRMAGTGWTVVRTLQRLGSDVSFATYVGADSLGRLADHNLRLHGLYGAATQVCEDHPRSVVLYDEAGRRANTRDLRTAPDLRYPADVFASVLDGRPRCDFAVLTNVGFTRRLIPMAARRRIPFATDLHLLDDLDDPKNHAWLHSAHLIACSHERLPESPERWTRRLWERFGTEIVLIGCGSEGAVLGLRASREVWRIDATTPRGVHYTSGAGDTLLASFVHHRLVLGDPVEAARHAVLTAGWKVGGKPEEPSGLEYAELMRIAAAHGLPQARLVP